MIGRPTIRIAILGAALLVVAGPGLASAKHFSDWGPAVAEVGINTSDAEGCPIESPGGLQLYIASNRPGSTGGYPADPNDIWMATRTSTSASWGTPVNVGNPVNSSASDYCPTPLTGNRLFFVSTRSGPGACGGGDIYLTRRNPAHGWEAPTHLACAADGGPNSTGGEFGPSLIETAQGTFLYFSSNGGEGDQDIYVSRQAADGSFGPATVVTELSVDGYDDFMPNIHRNGLEMVMNSNRAGNQDIYSAHRPSTADPWSTPVRLGPNVNTDGNETRASISADGERLHFGRNGDIFVSIRTKVTGRS